MTVSITTTVPFNRLAASEDNVRKIDKARNIDALAASIKAQGLLQNLVVVAMGADDENMASHAVVAGRRRYLALCHLYNNGDLAADFPVPVKVIDADDTTVVSLIENTQREAMHPADEFDSFRALTQQGYTIDAIADTFGVTPLVVERRLKLMKANPALIEEFRYNAMTVDQLIALCSTDDHNLQAAVWVRSKAGEWLRKPEALRSAVLGGEIDASNDPRVAFIGGLNAYEQAGGIVRRDLFSTDGEGGFINDVSLLDKLVAEALEKTAEAVKAEGWGWVETWEKFDWTAYYRFGHAPKSTDNLPDSIRAKVEALRTEDKALREELDAIENSEEDEYTEEQSERIDEIYDRNNAIDEEIEALMNQGATYALDVMANSGAIVSLDNGKLRIERGMVKTADRKAVATAAGDKHAVTGGRETESAGRKDGNTLSDALHRSLLGHRNLAAQTVMLTRPDVAKVLMACWAVTEVRGMLTSRYTRNGTPCDLSVTQGAGTRSMHPITDDAGKAGIEAFNAACELVIEDLPKDDNKLWDLLAAKSTEELDRIITVAVARSVSLDSNHAGITGKLLAALDFDMADHFTATADNYLGRVSKGLAIEALKEAKQIKSKDDEALLSAMKKGKLAEEAEKRLAGTGWTPKLIRSPKPKAAKVEKPKADAKAPAKKAAAKKAPAKASAKKAKADAQPAA